jgi:zinc protease
MKSKAAVTILVLAMAAIGVFAQSADVDIPFQKFVLDNSLTLIVHEDHKAPIVAVTTNLTLSSRPSGRSSAA